MHVLLFGATELVHDYHAGEGAFRSTLDALRRYRGGLVTTPVTRSNFRHLGDLPDLLARLSVRAWRLAVVPPTRTPDPVAPRLAMVAPHVLRALARAEERGVPAAVQGLPLCLMGPYADRSLPRDEAGPASCAGCPAAASCAEVTPTYAERFGRGELRPRGPVVLRPAPALFPALSWPQADLPGIAPA